jgi:hypothetical protein
LFRAPNGLFASKVKQLATTDCTIDTLGRSTTVPGSTPITRPIVSHRDRTAGSHEPQALIESFSHSSMNCIAY